MKALQPTSYIYIKALLPYKYTWHVIIEKKNRILLDAGMTMGRDLYREEKKLVEEVRAMTSSLKNTVKRLRGLADDLDKVRSDCQRVSAVGTGVGILGGVLTIGGGVATIMTAGAAAPLLVAGTALGATAACTNLGTSAVEAILNSNITKKAERAVEKANSAMQKVKNQINELRKVKVNFACYFVFGLLP